MISFIAIHAPNEKPDNQISLACGFKLCSQSSAAAASLSSPSPLSNWPSEWPTPLKLNLKTENPFLANDSYSL